MRLVITGATGFIGKQLIPILKDQGIELLLVGRNPDILAEHHDIQNVASYDDLSIAAKGYDAILHLAAKNNDQSGSLDDFRKANVVLLQNTVEAAKDAGVNLFINVTSAQAIDASDASFYAQSKAEGEAYLEKVSGIEVVSLCLPAVYGSSFAGKLSFLNRIPSFIRPLFFQIVASLKPTVSVERVAVAVNRALNRDIEKHSYISDKQNGNIVFSALKRTIDYSFALFVIVFLWWLLLGAWIAVRLSGSGGAIFAQERIGRNEKPFTCYKFRTMHIGTKQAGTHEVQASAVTRVGAFLRKTKVDELPQILNILRNELSLIGPRPGLPVQKELISARRKYGVYDILPGITGWAQIQNIDMSDPDRLARTDSDYIAKRGLILDLKIALATAFGRGQGDKVSN